MTTSTPPSWDVNARVTAVLKEHEHPSMTDERLGEMKRAAQHVFTAAILERGTDPERFELVIHIDELVGPMAFVGELHGKKRTWPIAAFQGWLNHS